MTSQQSRPGETQAAQEAFGGAEGKVTPIAVVIAITQSRHTRHVVVRCPFCDKPHTHGLPYGDDLPAHRVAHCGVGTRGYRIEAAS